MGHVTQPITITIVGMISVVLGFVAAKPNYLYIMGIGFVIIAFWLVVVAAVLQFISFTTVSGLLGFLAWSYLVIYCSIYACVIFLFMDVGKKASKGFMHERILSAANRRKNGN